MFAAVWVQFKQAQFDATITAIEVNQGLQNGNQPLTGKRSTFVRVSTQLVSPPTVPLNIDGLMRVYQNGVELPESPIFSIKRNNNMKTVNSRRQNKVLSSRLSSLRNRMHPRLSHSYQNHLRVGPLQTATTRRSLRQSMVAAFPRSANTQMLPQICVSRSSAIRQ